MILNNVDNIMLGAVGVDKVMRGSTKVWERSTGQIFGFHIDPTKANASQAVSYLADAVGKTPAAMGNTFSYGDWADAFFMPKPCMLRYDGTVAYYLDKSNYAYREHTDYVSSSVFEYGGFYTGSEPDPAKRGQPKPIDGDEQQFRYIRDLTYYEIPVGTTTLYGLVKTPIAVSGKGNLTLVYVYQYDANKSFLAQSWSGKDSGSSDIFYDKQNLPIPIDPATKYIRISYGQIWYDGAGSEMLPVIPDPSAFDGQFIVSNTPILSDISNPEFEGNAMMEWSKIWYKFVQGTADGEGEFYCANYKVDNSYHCWCNYDADNNIIDHFYTAIYNGCVIDGKMRSLSGVQLSSNASDNTTNKSMSNDIAYAEANNSSTDKNWYINVFSDMALITALTMMIFHRIDMNYIVTPGGLARDATYITGTSDNRGLFYGIPDIASETKIFGMENYIGYMYRWVAGVSTNKDYEVGLKYTRGTADGTKAADYNSEGSYYLVDKNKTLPTNFGHITKMWFLEGGIYPRETRDPSEFTDNNRYYNNGYASNVEEGFDYGVLIIRSGNEFDEYDPYQQYPTVGAALTCKPVKGEANN